MTRIRPAFTPGSSNNSGLFAYGQVFDVAAPVVADGVWWYQPATGDVTDVDVFMWNAAEAQLASGGALAGAITPGAWNLVPFGAPSALSVATGYRYSAEASGQTGFDSSDQGYPIASPDSAVSATSGAFLSGGGFPSSTWTGQHGVDLEYTADTDPAQGSAALGLELAVAAAGARPSRGVAAFVLNLALAAAGQVTTIPATALTATAPTSALSAGQSTSALAATAPVSTLTAR